MSTTHPNAVNSVRSLPEQALYVVYPPELRELVIPLAPKLDLGRERTSQSHAFAAIPHPTVSRRHAMIGESIGGTVPTLVDLGGRNGTRVNGQQVQGSVALLPQSVVRFGDVIGVVDEHLATPDAERGVPPGISPRIVRLRELLLRAAGDRAPVLIVGETGTGKELLASEVHRLSSRAGALVRLNCAELSSHLVESQLFGHERGAFTGAIATQAGLFVAADGGTLFLDEVAEIPVELQAKLLRALQDGEVRPVGSVRTRATDVRVICATNVDLAARVEAGEFRRDLYARLSFFELRLPPLRERRQDILWWIERFRRRWSEDRGRPAGIDLRPPVAEHLLLSSWVDNLRGIDRLVHRLLADERTTEVGMNRLNEVMPELFEDGEPLPVPAKRPSERPTRKEFVEVYERLGKSVRATAKHFQRDRRQIYRWLEHFGVERDAGDGEE